MYPTLSPVPVCVPVIVRLIHGCLECAQPAVLPEHQRLLIAAVHHGGVACLTIQRMIVIPCIHTRNNFQQIALQPPAVGGGRACKSFLFYPFPSS